MEDELRQYKFYLRRGQSDWLDYYCGLSDMSRSQIMRGFIDSKRAIFEENQRRKELQRKRDELIGSDDE